VECVGSKVDFSTGHLSDPQQHHPSFLLYQIHWFLPVTQAALDLSSLRGIRDPSSWLISLWVTLLLQLFPLATFLDFVLGNLLDSIGDRKINEKPLQSRYSHKYAFIKIIYYVIIFHYYITQDYIYNNYM
jgi:hypothetical protein